MSGAQITRWSRFEPPLLLQGGDLGDFLDRAFPGVTASAVEFIDRGVVNSNYRVELRWPAGLSGPGRVLLRLSRSDEGPRREGAIGEILASTRPGLAPRLLATEAGERPERHRRSIFTWLEGTPLAEFTLAGQGAVAPAERAAEELALALVDLHTVDPGAFGPLDPTGRPAPDRSARRWADDLSRRVATRLENPAHGLDGRALERVRTGFARLLAPLWARPGCRPSLVHGDLSAGNILLTAPVAGAGPGLAGLVDWEMARASDPATDFASLRLEAAPTRPGFARRVEESYQEEQARRGGEAVFVDWPRRVALASVPALLDARMVAVRRAAGTTLAAIDDALLATLGGGWRDR